MQLVRFFHVLVTATLLELVSFSHSLIYFCLNKSLWKARPGARLRGHSGEEHRDSDTVKFVFLCEKRDYKH